MLLRGKRGGKFGKIGIIFIGVAGLLFLAVFNMALARATIIIEPNAEPINADLLVRVKEFGLHSGDILGKIEKIEASGKAVFTPEGEGKEAPAQAEGEIIVYNNHSKNQPLIKTTRFLSKDNVLFRLKENIVVPAGGQVKAQVYADKKGKSGNIEPTKFTIPGLSASLQKKIYGESESAMTGGVRKFNVITQEDINKAIENARASVFLKAKAQLEAILNKNGDFVGIAYTSNIKSKEVDKQVGQEASQLTAAVELEAIGVAFSKDFYKKAEETLKNIVSSDRELISSGAEETEATVEKYDLNGRSAILKANLEGKTILKSSNGIFEKDKLAGKNQQEVQEYLNNYSGIKNIEIKFFPFWVSKVPKLKDHIKIVIK